MMTKKFLSLTWLLSLGLFLAGCGSSPPNNYYLLSSHEFPAPGGNQPAVGIGPIQVPEYLSRSNMAYNRMENKLQVASLDLWAEPLADGIQRVMALNLAGLLNSQNVRTFPWHPKRPPDFSVKVNLLQLDANEGSALLIAEWLVYNPANNEPIERRISRLQVPLAADMREPEAVAAAYSALVFQLTEIVTAAITSAQAAGPRNHSP